MGTAIPVPIALALEREVPAWGYPRKSPAQKVLPLRDRGPSVATPIQVGRAVRAFRGCSDL